MLEKVEKRQILLLVAPLILASLFVWQWITDFSLATSFQHSFQTISSTADVSLNEFQERGDPNGSSTGNTGYSNPPPSSPDWYLQNHPDEVKQHLCRPFVDAESGQPSYSWQDLYKETHNRILNDTLPQKYLVYTPTAHQGLGDNQKGLLWAMNAAVITQRAFVINWKVSEFNKMFVPNEVNSDVFSEVKEKGLTWQKMFADAKDVSGRAKSDSNWFAKADWSYDVMEYTGNLGTRMDDMLVIDPKLNWRAGHTYINNMYVDYAYGCLHDFFFKYNRTFEEIILKAEKDLYGDRNNTIVIAFHARIGDGHLKQNMIEEGIQRANYKYKEFRRCARRIEERFGLKNSSLTIKWFITSDMFEFKEIAKRNESEKVVYLDITPLHFDTIKGRKENPDVGGFEAETSIWLEQALIARSDYLLLLHSGFSEKAAQFGFLGYDRVFHPTLCDCEMKSLPEYIKGTGPMYRHRDETLELTETFRIEQSHWPHGRTGCGESPRRDFVWNGLLL